MEHGSPAESSRLSIKCKFLERPRTRTSASVDVTKDLHYKRTPQGTLMLAQV